MQSTALVRRRLLDRNGLQRAGKGRGKYLLHQKFMRFTTPSIIIGLIAVLSGLAASVVSLSAVVGVAYVPLLFFSITTAHSKRAFWYGFLFGCVHFFLSFIWLYNALPLSWLIPNYTLAFATIFVITVVLACGGGLVLGIVTVSARFLWRLFQQQWLRIIVFVAGSGLLFALAEYVRPWLYSFIFQGQQPIEPFLTFGSPAYLVASFAGLSQFARYGDIYALSFLIGVTSAIVAIIYIMKRQWFLKVLIGYIGILFFVNYALVPSPYVQSGIPVRVVGVGLNEPVLHDKNLAATETLSDINIENAFVIFPESTGKGVLEKLNGKQSGEIYSSLRSDGDKKYSTAYVVSGTHIATIDKHILAIGGEYIPSIVGGVYSWVSPSVKKRAVTINNLAAGSEGTVVETPLGPAGVLFCNEIYTPVLVSNLSNKGAKTIIVLASHAWFSNAKTLERQTKAALQLRAIANNIPIIQVTNMGNSYAIGPQGQVLVERKPSETMDIVWNQGG